MSRRTKVLVIVTILSLSAISWSCESEETHTKTYSTVYMSNNHTGAIDTLHDVLDVRGIKNHVVDFANGTISRYSMGSYSYSMLVDSTVTFRSWGGARIGSKEGGAG